MADNTCYALFDVCLVARGLDDDFGLGSYALRGIMHYVHYEVVNYNDIVQNTMTTDLDE